ncbi:hypothetical protein YC2023_095050 [Brassica napus]|uniref:(rape) hypothetical protein n=1 Tax=Brassica napus TaxID=3708 RepID=A0A816ZTN8_BRANA|nr:unnamed protein product [Brassica napus]
MSVNISGYQNLEANLINHEATESSSSSVPQTKNYKRWLCLSSYLFFVLFCQPLATILGRLYYEMLLSQIKQPKSTEINFNLSPSFTILASVYMCIGLSA